MGRRELPGEVVELLRCPVCAGPLAQGGGCLVCPSRHTFDVARQGYVNLLTHPPRSPGDSREMVGARRRLLDSGAFAPLEAAVASAARRFDPAAIVDVGAGTGRYLVRALEAVPGALGLAVDVSVHAARVAGRIHARAGAVVADVWRQLPLGDAVAEVVLSVFAPRNPPEMRRVLAAGGGLVVVIPERRHLAGLRDALGLLRVDPDKPERLERSLAGCFEPLEQIPLSFALRLNRERAADLALMGPSGHHLSPQEITRRLAAVPEPVTTEVAVRVLTWRAR